VPKSRIKDKFIKLPLAQKLIGAGSLIALISVFLPWYQDFDKFGIGVQFYGFTGPLYLVGYIILVLSIFSLILTGFHLMEKKIPSLPMKESMIYLISGVFGLFLLLIANTVYFHDQFGFNITSKSYEIGMILAFAGICATTIGGVLMYKERGTSRLIKEFEDETRLDPILELNNFQKEIDEEPTTENIKEEPVIRQPEPQRVHQRTEVKGREYKARPNDEPQRVQKPISVPYSGGLQTSITDETKVRQEPYPDPASLRKEHEEKQEVNPNSVIRTDL
jgi:hypothetical protein